MTDQPRKRSWMGKYTGGSKDKDVVGLPSPREGQELSEYMPSNVASSSTSTGSSLLFRRSDSMQSISSLLPSRPTTPLSTRRLSASSNVLTKEDTDSQNALERTPSLQQTKSDVGRTAGSFSKMSLSSMMSSLTLNRGGSEDKERGRLDRKDKERPPGVRSSSFSGTQEERDSSRGRTRSQSPFRLRRVRTRDTSPTVEALTQSDAESEYEESIRPRNAFSLSAQSDDESGDEEVDDDEGSEESWSDDDEFDSVTEANTERNSLIPPDLTDHDVVEPDPLGEGVNVVVPPEPYFPSTLNGGTRNPRRRKSTRPHETLPMDTSRPIFQRDRCTITLTHGDPARSVQETGRRPKRYVLASDLSEESRYALEWGIGTVLRDGDEMLIVNVIENEAKVDPLIPNPADRTAKLRSQQERQGLAYILVRQATGLLQRTRLNVTISCQAWHAKNSRHMLLDIIDHVGPTMLIVGSRGLGNIKGILLGSTSHYLIQKCSVPVMVARRRLKRPPKRSAHLAPHRARVSLAQAAGIDRIAPRVDQDVAVMRDQIQREEERGAQGENQGDENQGDEGDEDDADTEVEGDMTLGRKVAGE